MSDVGEGLYKVYEEYSKTLRTWFVAYGVGAPVFLLTNDSLREMVKNSGDGRWLATVFLVGVAAQVGVAALNKTAA